MRNFSKIVKPLNNLCKKETKFEWTETEEKVFQTLKRLMTSAPVLVHPNMNRPFILETVCSDYAMGAVLSQWVENSTTKKKEL